MPFGVHSEVGKLRQVMVHRPGLEHARADPSNAEELLFDDVLWVAWRRPSMTCSADVMRERGVEVFEAEDAAWPRRWPSARPGTGCAVTS